MAFIRQHAGFCRTQKRKLTIKSGDKQTGKIRVRTKYPPAGMAGSPKGSPKFLIRATNIEVWVP